MAGPVSLPMAVLRPYQRLPPPRSPQRCHPGQLQSAICAKGRLAPVGRSTGDGHPARRCTHHPPHNSAQGRLLHRGSRGARTGSPHPPLPQGSLRGIPSRPVPGCCQYARSGLRRCLVRSRGAVPGIGAVPVAVNHCQNRAASGCVYSASLDRQRDGDRLGRDSMFPDQVLRLSTACFVESCEAIVVGDGVDLISDGVVFEV